MPTVTSYQPKQELAPIQGGRMNASPNPEAAANVGRQLTKLGANIYHDEIERQDQVATLEADRKLSEWEQTRLYDPKNGALTRRGKDAFGLPDEVNQEFQKFTGELRNGLANERQQATVEKLIAARSRDLNTTLTRHVFQEIKQFDNQETSNYLKNSRQAATNNYNDPERIALELDRQHAAISDFAKRNGIVGSETEKQLRSQTVSDTHVSVIQRYVANGQDQFASEYFTAVKGSIAGDDIIKVEASLKNATTEGEAQRAVADVWGKSGPKSLTDPVDQNKLSDEIRSKYADNPGVLKASIQALHERVGAHNATQREYNEANGSAIWSAIEGGAGLNKVRSMPQFYLLPGKEREAIKNHIVDRARQADDRSRRDGDMSAYYDLVNLSSDDKRRAEFVNMNLLSEYRAKLSDGDFKHFATLQAAMRKGDVRESDKLMASDRVQKQIVDDALLSLKLDPTPNEKTSASKLEQILGFRRTVRESVRQLEGSQGKNATDVQVQEVVDNLLTKGNVAGSGVGGYFQTERRVYELKEGENLVVKKRDIPKDELKKIQDALQRAGRVATDEAVTTMYHAKLLRMRGVKTERPPQPGDPKYVPQ